MNSKKQLSQLFLYNFWAHRKVADALSGHALKYQAESSSLLAHICAAEQIWYKRITNQPGCNIQLWPDSQPVIESFEKLKELHEQWATLLRDESQTLEKKISYKNSKGITFSMFLADILHHVIIHGQHHRAQIASLLRHNDINPPATDYIFYLRKTNK